MRNRPVVARLVGKKRARRATIRANVLAPRAADNVWHVVVKFCGADTGGCPPIVFARRRPIFVVQRRRLASGAYRRSNPRASVGAPVLGREPSARMRVDVGGSARDRPAASHLLRGDDASLVDRSTGASRRRRWSPRSAASTCARVTVALACLYAIHAAWAGAAWFASRARFAAHYLDDVGDWTDLVERPGVREAIRGLVRSGALSGVGRQTIERIHLTTLGGDAAAAALAGVDAARFPVVQTLGVDVSQSGEASWLYGRFKRLLAERTAEVSSAGATPRGRDRTRGSGGASGRLTAEEVLGFAPLVVDVGANDGFLSSNSYNLVRWGWSSVLVEPNPEMLDLARAAQKPLLALVSDPAQTACYVNAGMAGVKTPEKTRLRLGGDVVDMESSLLLDDARRGSSDAREDRLAKLRATGTGSEPRSGGAARTVEVDVLPAAEVARRCEIPKRFAALSVDAEGVGDRVLREWLEGGFRPQWILYEDMHNAEPFRTTRQWVEALGWRYAGKIGWNRVFERID